jgi:hypothetical protein
MFSPTGEKLMISYIKARLGEHGTQLALSTDFGSLIAALSGQIAWGVFATVVIGSLPAILIPATSGAAR